MVSPSGDAMSDTLELDAKVAAAGQAAGAGDYASAERLLRDVLQVQEQNLGPTHPDLANTLNNLGVVCDMADKPDEAEKAYRRAHAIAAAAFAPDHPFVVTSRKNLEEFCAARGRPRPFEPRQAAAPEVRPPAVSRRDEQPKRSLNPILIGVGAVAMVGIIV